MSSLILMAVVSDTPTLESSRTLQVRYHTQVKGCGSVIAWCIHGQELKTE